MLRRITVAVIAIAVLAAGAPSAEAGKLRSKYRDLREQVVKTHGKQAAGRNIVKDGVRKRGKDRPAKKAELVKSISVFGSLLAPPARSSSTTPVASSSGLESGSSWSGPSTSSGSSSCGTAIPGYIIDRESGGDPNARNPSGAFGCYQLMPLHFGAGGECAGLGTDQAGQDECASRLWDGGRGSGHWAATR